MDSEINRSSSITGPQAAIHTHSQPFGDSREHMGSILYPRVRPVRHRVHRSEQPLQQDAMSAETEPVQATGGEARDKASQPQPRAAEAPANAHETRKE